MIQAWGLRGSGTQRDGSSVDDWSRPPIVHGHAGKFRHTLRTGVSTGLISPLNGAVCWLEVSTEFSEDYYYWDVETWNLQVAWCCKRCWRPPFWPPLLGPQRTPSYRPCRYDGFPPAKSLISHCPNYSLNFRPHSKTAHALAHRVSPPLCGSGSSCETRWLPQLITY